MQAGALAFLESKMRTADLFELRDHMLPQAEFSKEVLTGIKECMQDVLKLCDQLAPNSVEQLSMRTIAETLLHLLCAQGPRHSDMLDSISLFRKGKWEKLWNTAIKNYKNAIKLKNDFYMRSSMVATSGRDTNLQFFESSKSRGLNSY